MATLTNQTFQSYATKHALLVTAAGTLNLDACIFDQSGTNDIETTHATGTVTINVSNGGTVPGVTETGAGAVVVNNNVTILITVTDDVGTVIENARVEVSATETVGTITTGDVILTGLTNASGIITTTAFNYESAFNPSGLDISVKARQGSVSPYKVPSTITGTITTAGFSQTIPLQPDE